jgi:hypothetical protein
MKDAYVEALTACGDDSITKNADRLFSRLHNLFVREADTNTGLGSHYLVDVFGSATGGNCGVQLISIFCENHEIPLWVGRGKADNEPIRDIVKRIMEESPPRCAIVLDTRNNALLQKVRTRIARTQCDLRYRRVIFCLTDQDMPAGSFFSILHVPGSTDDKMAMILYHIPTILRKNAKSLRPLAEAMVDYTLFEPRIWKNVIVDGTVEEFLSTALYQVVRRVGVDPGIGDAFPSFEVAWRTALATKLKSALETPPEVLCPSIHRVIPIGVLPEDAMQAMKVAIPTDIQNPYAITVESAAVDDRCGSIAITQPMKHTVVHIHCTLDTGLLVEVCRELRVGHRAVVSEVQSVRQEVRSIRSDMLAQTEQLTRLQESMATLLLQNAATTSTVQGPRRAGQCTKNSCTRLVTKRFRSGKMHRQCSLCVANK